METVKKASCACSSDNCPTDEGPENLRGEMIKAGAAFVLVAAGILMEVFKAPLMQIPYAPIIWFAIPYAIVMADIVKHFFELILQKDFFNEITLMTTASIIAFIIGYPAEGAGVMVFYAIGELFEASAAGKARRNIKALLEVRPDLAYLVEGDSIRPVAPDSVAVGTILEVKTGERVPLDGVLLGEKATFNTAALTGESVPRSVREGEPVLAGMISDARTIRFKTTKLFNESTLARVLDMVQNAAQNKAPTEAFMRKFSHVYTPVVAALALGMVVVPFAYSLFAGIPYDAKKWLYTACITLIISCPCAFVISVPLGYFGGIGLAARHGILFKGGNFLEAITHLKYLVTDKTGTMTKGVFTIQNIHSENMEAETLVALIAAVEQKSTHPIAKAICDYAKEKGYTLKALGDSEEIAGHGLRAVIDQKTILVGNQKLMDKFGVSLPSSLPKTAKTSVFCAIDGAFAGSLILADEIKEDAKAAVRLLHSYGIKVIMLSGDRKEIAEEIGAEIGVDEAYGDLLPDGKAEFVQKFKQNNKGTLAFAGDGINDAPVLALSDIGIAMGTMGSDLAIETADLVIQTDEPSKIVSAINAARITRGIVMQNIIFAFAVKFVVMALAIGDMATLWEGIFADVGVSILAIFNAIRIQGKKINPRL